jgi:hypothetical protein
MRLKVAIDNSKTCDFYEKYEWKRISINYNSDEQYIINGKKSKSMNHKYSSSLFNSNININNCIL